MTDIIQTNIDDILNMFQRGAEVRSCEQLDLQDMNRRMSEEIGMLSHEYQGVFLAGAINPFFRLLDTASILSAYVAKYTSCVIQYSSQMDIEHIILATQMSDRIDRVSEEIKKLRTNLKNK
jgi:hypothetical protein